MKRLVEDFTVLERTIPAGIPACGREKPCAAKTERCRICQDTTSTRNAQPGPGCSARIRVSETVVTWTSVRVRVILEHVCLRSPTHWHASLPSNRRCDSHRTGEGTCLSRVIPTPLSGYSARVHVIFSPVQCRLWLKIIQWGPPLEL